MINNDLIKTWPGGMSSNYGIYTLPKSEGYLLALRQLKLLKPYAGIKEKIEFNFHRISSKHHRLFPSFSMLFRGLSGFRNTAENFLNASLLLMSLKPLPFPEQYGLDVLSHPMKAWGSRNRGDRTHLGHCTSVRKNGKIQFKNNFFTVCYYWCPLQSSKFLCISDHYFARYERNKETG